jgi:malonate transporter and related proteins
LHCASATLGWHATKQAPSCVLGIIRAMSHPVITALVPVVILIAAGFVAGKLSWISRESTKDLTNLVFLLLSPCLLFRAMSQVHVEQLSFAPVAAYFLGAGVIYATTLALGGFNPRTAVLALASTYGNTVSIGIPLIALAYGAPGMVTLLTLVSVHAVVMLTTATVVLELTAQHAPSPQTSQQSLRQTLRHTLRSAVPTALRKAIIHPVPLPILAGLLWAQTGWVVPDLLDRPLALLGQAFGPMGLVLVGITLAHTPVGPHLRAALGLSVLKNLVHPALVGAFAWCLGVRGLPLTVMVVAASLPIGANVFLFSQRYGVAQALVTASVAVSTALALATVSVVMMVVGR